jgi:hypothetical protein
MRKLTAACVAVATLEIGPALAGDYFPWAGYAWRPTVSYRDYYADHYTDHYTYYYPRTVAPDGRYWSRPNRRYSWRR